ncbi:61_t:CDS:2 [Acaulospora colombiana]|uniref:61_t:CDS:1 n=1 Tax=Acaulospora colombiana TaxID=27376 RepID=A0ACA9MCU4_9GLOM|nr:61_t:CDS:2 [Acaulospora colombiana]
MASSSTKMKPNRTKKKSYENPEKSVENPTSTSKGQGKIQVKTESRPKTNNIFEKYIISSEDEPELPQDTWGTIDKDWEVEKIVDEAVDLAGKHKYQVRSFKLANGTSTTWVEYKTLIGNAGEVLKDWESEKARRIIERRKYYAKHGYPVSLFSNQCVYVIHFMELGMGRDQELTPEMKFTSSLGSLNGADWNDEIAQVKAEALPFMKMGGVVRAEKNRPDKISPSHPSVKRSESEAQHRAPSTPVTSVENATISPSQSVVTPSKRPFRGPLSAQKRHELKQSPTQPIKRSSSPNLAQSTPSKRRNTGKNRRVWKRWNSATQEARAASVTLVNDVDDETVPASVDWQTFEYIENGPYRS